MSRESRLQDMVYTIHVICVLGEGLAFTPPQLFIALCEGFSLLRDMFADEGPSQWVTMRSGAETVHTT